MVFRLIAQKAGLFSCRHDIGRAFCAEQPTHCAVLLDGVLECPYPVLDRYCVVCRRRADSSGFNDQTIEVN